MDADTASIPETPKQGIRASAASAPVPHVEPPFSARSDTGSLPESAASKDDVPSAQSRLRARWQPYMDDERQQLLRKLASDPHKLDFLSDFWNPIYDERDKEQYQRMADTWKLRAQGVWFKSIAGQLGIDQRQACAY